MFGSRWAFEAKTDRNVIFVRYKARFALRGRNFFKFPWSTSVIRTVIYLKEAVLALAAKRSYEICRLDVKTTFLQSNVDEMIHVEQLEEIAKHGRNNI